MNKKINLLLSTGKIPLKSTGQSMLPILYENDIVYFKKISFSKIKVNDLIVFKMKSKLITHRVVYKTNKYLITKGDNNPASDGKIYPRKILGKVYKIKRNGQTFNPETFYLLQSTNYFQEIVKIKNEFDKKNINYVFLKGLPLHLYFEGSHPQRLYADCDVLVDKKDFEKAEEILFSFDYQKADTSLSSFQEKLQDKKVENAYWKMINGFSVVFDLHLEAVFMMTQLGKLEALYPQKLIDDLTHEFLETKRKIKINEEFFFILDTKYLILYLALHLFHHNFQGAFRYDFLDKVVRKETLSVNRLRDPFRLKSDVRRNPLTIRASLPLPYSKLTDLITKYHLQNFVYPVFVLLKKYYQTPISSSFLKNIRPSNLYLQYLSFIFHQPSSIFNDEPRLHAGINRFKNLFLLSPSPFWKKILIFFNPQVIFAVFWVIWKRIKKLFWI
jgi:signal peptidase I